VVHGWPQTWYAGRLLMPALVRDFRVIAVDKRGIGLSDKPHDGYDTGTLAGDLVALMDVLDHPRFAVVSGSPTRRLTPNTAYRRRCRSPHIVSRVTGRRPACRDS